MALKMKMWNLMGLKLKDNPNILSIKSNVKNIFLYKIVFKFKIEHCYLGVIHKKIFLTLKNCFVFKTHKIQTFVFLQFWIFHR